MYQRPTRFNLLPDVIKNLLIINGLFFLGTIVVGSTFQLDLGKVLGLYLPGSANFEPYQFITHMFMHADIGHIFFNMFALWMFGYALENYWGAKRFLIFYLVTGLGAAFIHLGVNYYEAMSLKSELFAMGYSASDLQAIIQEYNQPGMYNTGWSDTLTQYVLKYNIPTVGASGAVFGVLLAFGMMFPDTRIYLYFAIPVKAKYFVMVYGALELYNGLANDPTSNVAHFAHLGGMLFGYLLIKYWQKNQYR
jgi:membrane associated rhomboid family serine protease